MLFAGLDLGTSGIRLCLIDAEQSLIAQYRMDYAEVPAQDCQVWWHATIELIQQIPASLRKQIVALSIDGTSGSLLLVDRNSGEALSEALLYNDHDPQFELPESCRVSADKTLNDTQIRALRLLSAYQEQGKEKEKGRPLIVSQADYIQGILSSRQPVSDDNNMYKLGFDSVQRAWPDWLSDCGIAADMLPQVLSPGSRCALISPARAAQLGVNPALQLVTGTTDSVAAVVATGIHHVGAAVTSLGSTLVVKVLSDKPVVSARFGIYSQPYRNKWLVGGASNCGAQVLRQFFSGSQVSQLSEQMTIDEPTGLRYYPLSGTGERFPVNDPLKEPVLEPRPESDVVYLQAILEALAQVEKEGYELLYALGAPAISSVVTVGGGSRNSLWIQMREQMLGVKVIRAKFMEAAYGSALLAHQGYCSDSPRIGSNKV